MERAAKPDKNDPRSETPARGYIVTWTTSPGCAIPAVEAQNRALQLAQHLGQVARLQEPLRIHLSVYPDACAGHHTGEIGLALRQPEGHTTTDGVPVETVDVLLVDGQALARRVAVGVPWSELSTRLARLIRTYQVEGCGRDTFATWARGLSDNELRERMGFTQPAPGKRSTKEESGRPVRAIGVESRAHARAID